MNKLVKSVLDPATLRSIEFNPNEITLHFVDGGIIFIRSPESASMFDSMQVESRINNESRM